MNMKRIIAFVFVFSIIFFPTLVFANEDTGIWDVRYYVDEFNMPTEEGYITNRSYFVGTFSNTAADNAPLKAELLLDKRVAIQLYEYGNLLVKGYHSKGDAYAINVLSPSGNKYEMNGILKKGSDRIFLSESYVSTFFDILSEDGEVRISMSEKEGTSSYFFIIPDSSNIENAYLQIFESMPTYQTGASEEINAEIDCQIFITDTRKVKIIMSTNLPDGLKLKITIKGSDGKKEPTYAVVEDGLATFIGYNSLPNMRREATLIVTIPKTDQSDEIKTMIGENMEKIAGPCGEGLKSVDGYRIKFTY